MIIDTIILSEAHPLENKELDDLYTMSVTLRAHSMSSFFSHMWLYSDNKEFYPDVNFRYLIAPSENLSLIPLNFGWEHLERIMKVGE